MVKIPAIIIENVNIFTIYETLFKNVITILPTTYQNKTKMPGKKRKCLVFLIRSCKLYKLYTRYFDYNIL